MNTIIESTIERLAESGNLRKLPDDAAHSLNIDFSSNDYLGLAAREDLRNEFFENRRPEMNIMSSSASRLLARHQAAARSLETVIATAYGGRREALLFNSGYHANTGLVGAFASTNYHIVADRLVHASIIDGIKLSGLPFDRFRHNDMAHLERLVQKVVAQGRLPLIIAESVYSMDGDKADIDAIIDIKKHTPGALLYIDEAHAVGVEGPGGLGLCRKSSRHDEVDIVVGTFGKALASAGAYALLSPEMRIFMINRARSLVFSTALPPLTLEWSEFIFRRALGMDSERQHLKDLSLKLAAVLSSAGQPAVPSHIKPLMVGDPHRAVELSQRLREAGIDALPIRVPTVPAGTDRIRFSLSAAMNESDIVKLGNALKLIYGA